MRHKFGFWVWVRALFAIVYDQRQNDLSAANELQPRFPGSFADLRKTEHKSKV